MTTSATGTTDLFAALNVATGEVLYDCREHHTGKDVLQFFKLINLHVARNLDIHVVLDNLSAHMGPEVTDWLAPPQTGSLAPALHPHQLVLAEHHRALVQRTHRPSPTQRRVHQRGRPHRCHRDLGRTLEPRPRALHLAQDRRRDHHKSPPRTSRPPPDQIRDAPLVGIPLRVDAWRAFGGGSRAAAISRSWLRFGTGAWASSASRLDKRTIPSYSSES